MALTKVEFHSGLAVGDSLMMTCAIRDLKASYPDKYLIQVVTTAQHIWDNNPNLAEFDNPDMIIELGPKRFVQGSQTRGLHYTNGFRESIEYNLNISIKQGPLKPDLYLSDEEKADKIVDGRYWILIAGGKPDFGTKIWPTEYWQEVVSALPQITFVQLGESKHDHPVIQGDNIIDLIGTTGDPETGLRDLFKLFYHCDGSLGLVSMQMHLAAAFDKACVIVAGAREPASFEQYNHHRYLHNQGSLRCKNDCENCKNHSTDGKRSHYCSIVDSHIPKEYWKDSKRCDDYDPIDPAKLYIKSCWKSKIEQCTNLVSRFGTDYPKCIIMIQPDDVIRAINSYYEGGALQVTKEKAKVIRIAAPMLDHEPFPTPTDKPIFKMVCNAHAYIGGEKSVAWIINAMEKEGYHIQLVPTNGVCDEFKRHISSSVEITEALTDSCDILMIYANDMIWEFEKEEYKVMERVKADKKILMLNFKLGGAGKAEWTKHWDLYGFLCSTMRDDFLKRVPGANCFVLPPAVDIEPFLVESINYNRTLHLVRHSSQGDRKYSEDTNDLIEEIRDKSPSTIFSFMPAPSFLNGAPKVHRFNVNQLSVVDFLKRGTCYWYRLPEKYTDQGPRTIVEAMAIGLPVIADNRWGAKDRVVEETGWLCENREDYIDIISQLNHKVLTEKGLAAKERARKEFDPNKWVEAIES